jgi:hypothetical protein
VPCARTTHCQFQLPGRPFIPYVPAWGPAWNVESSKEQRYKMEMVWPTAHRGGEHGPRGAKTKSTDPPVHLLNLRPTHPPSDFFFLDFFLYVFQRFSAREVQKHHEHVFAKVLVENFSQNFDKKIDVSFSSTFYVLSRFRVFFSDGSSKTQQKMFCKKIVSKSFYKKFDQKSKTGFFSIFFSHVFGRFSMWGVQKHD